MKIIHFADLHIKLQEGRYQTELIEAIGFIITTVREQKPDYVVIAGDLMNSKHPSMTEFSLATTLMRNLLTYSKVIIVPGNHDEPANDELHNTLKPLENLRVDGLHVYNEVGIYNLGDIDILAVPYIYKNRPECLAKIKELHDTYTGDNLYLVGHFWIPGYGGLPYPDTEFIVPAEFLSSLSKVKFGLLGHIHIAGEAAPKYYYSGSPFRVTWGEKEISKVIYSYTDGVVTQITAPAVSLIELEFSEGLKDQIQDIKGKMVKLNANNLEVSNLVLMDEVKKILEANGNYVNIDLKLKGIKFDAINPTKKEMGFDPFLDEYVKKSDVVKKHEVLKSICHKIISGEIDKTTSPFDIEELKLKEVQ